MNRTLVLAVALLLLGWAMAAAQGTGGQTGMKMTSKAFEHEGMIPEKYSCDGADVSPPLAWQGVPPGAKSLALICEDPDAPGGVFDHWVLYGLAATATSLPEGVEQSERLPSGALQGRNSFRRIGYNGPCPPGGTHRYYFRLYALDATAEELGLKPGATKAALQKAMQGHVLEEAEFMGRYSR